MARNNNQRVLKMEAENSEDNTTRQSKFLFGDIFLYDPVAKKSKCQLPHGNSKCKTILVGCRPFNLIRHVKKVHTDFNAEIIKNSSRAEISEKLILSSCVESPSTHEYNKRKYDEEIGNGNGIEADFWYD